MQRRKDSHDMNNFWFDGVYNDMVNCLKKLDLNVKKNQKSM
jgi:hypothetical protein